MPTEFDKELAMCDAKGKADIVLRLMKKANISAEEAMKKLYLTDEEKEAVRKILAG